MTTPTIMRIMALSMNTVKYAGGIIRDVMKRGELNIVEKGKNDLQTEADRSAQRCIIASLTKQFPNIKIIGEEGCSDLNVPPEWIVTEFDQEFLQRKCPEQWCNVQDDEFVIWVDPLDGTSEYTQGYFEHVTVLIGVAVRENAVGGIIYQPYYKNESGEMGRTIWGLKCLGTGGIQPKTAPQGKFIITTTRSHLTETVQKTLDALSPDEVLKVGGAGYKVLALLEGKAHAYVFASPGCKKWDTCAPEAILEAEGGILTDILGEHYKYDASVEHTNKTGVLATFGKISHTDIVKKIPNDILKTFCK